MVIDFSLKEKVSGSDLINKIQIEKDFCHFNVQISGDFEDMWKKAFCYDALYNSNGFYAMEIIEQLKDAIEDMRAKRGEYIFLENGDGFCTYGSALTLLLKISYECNLHPDSTIEIITINS